MKPKNNFSYRIQQFQLAVNPPAQPVPTEELKPYLNNAQLALFRNLQPSEQWHAFKVFNKLKDDGVTQPELLKAGLLHDIGKILYPLKTWERVMIVVTKQISPSLIQQWGYRKPTGFFKFFSVASRHAELGADLISQTGASKELIELIRRHEENPSSNQDALLSCLQKADNSS